MAQVNDTFEEHSIYHEDGSEDGGVPLHDTNVEQMDIDYEESSTSSSTSMMSHLSLHSGVQPSLDSTQTTLPVFGPPDLDGTSATMLNEAVTSLPEQSTVGAESVPPEPVMILIGNPSQPHTLQLVQSQDDDVPASHAVPNNQNIYLPSGYRLHPPINENLSCDGFLNIWKELWVHRKPEFPPILYNETDPISRGRPNINPKIMAKTSCDIQGIRWSDFQTSKTLARHVRRMTSKNFGHMHELNPEQPSEVYATPAYSACFKSDYSPALSVTDDFFHFRETKLAIRPGYNHGQLRHCLCASSSNAVFYFEHVPYPHLGPEALQVKCMNPIADTSHNAMDLFKRHDPEAPRLTRIGCMTATDGLLIAGDLHEGHFAMKALSSTCNDADVRGIVNEAGFGGSGINHVHTFLHRRSGLPHAVFCDNAGNVRVMDCNTVQWVYERQWPSPVNCSATSPDGRLRIHVSDDPWPIVSDAETGETIARLPGHKDHGFACDWSPDGITMATGHQDGLVQVWDARALKASVHVLPAEMAGIRSLKFSPLGAGHPVLVMAEPMDFVSIVDARTFRSKQDIEFFGEISGFSMPPDGGSLFIGNADLKRGGIYEFERTGHSGDFKHRNFRCSTLQQRKNQNRQGVYNTTPEDGDCDDSVEEATIQARLKRKWRLDDQNATIWQTREHDWASEADIGSDRRTTPMKKQRWRRNLGLDEYIL